MILSCEDVRKVEKRANDTCIPYLQLMENAGAYCARIIRERYDNVKYKNVLVVCGKGKNGGDGFVIARKLWENDYDVTVLMADGLPVDEDSSEMFSRIRATDINISYYDENQKGIPAIKLFKKAELVVDCLFGIGFHGTPSDKMQDIINRMRISKGLAPVVSVDIPSGMYADSGELSSSVVYANLTIAIGCLKPCHALKPASNFCGEVVVADIGIPEEYYDEAPSACALLGENIDALLLKDVVNMPLVHKGTMGTLLCIGGSYEMPGAAYLTSKTAVNSGAGIVKVAFPDVAYNAIAAKTVEQILVPLPSNENGRISKNALPRIAKELQKCTAVVIGNGMGVDSDTEEITRYVLENSTVPVILDADGINAIKDNIDILDRVNCPLILTPHPGEMARLAKCSVAEIEANRVAVVKSFVDSYKATLVLKGTNTLLGYSEIDWISVNTTGDWGLATGGSGDVLAGLIGSFAAQGVKPDLAAMVGVHVHGLAGEQVSEECSHRGNTPSKVIDKIACILKKYE